MVNEATMTRRELKSRLWEIIRTKGIEVTNQNLDWLLERAWKSAQVTDVPSAETREKQIEEMEIALREAQHELDKAWHECLHNKGTQPRREFLFTAQYLVENKGYRKIHDDNAIQCVCYALGCQAAEKIKAEVAREIFDDAHDMLLKMLRDVDKELTKAMISNDETTALAYASTKETIRCVMLYIDICKKKYTEGEG